MQQVSDPVFAALSRKEDLLPELRRQMTDGPLGLMIRHPLVYSIAHHEGLNAFINESYRHKRRYLIQAWRKKDWGAVLAIHEKPYRPNVLCKIADRLSDQEFGELLGETLIGTENLWQWVPLLRQFLTRPNRQVWERSMMSDDELLTFDVYRERPVVRLYRGCTKQNARGWSWTVDYDKALWFAKRYGQKGGQVLWGTVPGRFIVAFFDGRGESEVVVNPRSVHVFKRERIADADRV